MTETAEVRRPEEGEAPEPEQPTPEPTEEPAGPQEPTEEPTEAPEPPAPPPPEGMSIEELEKVRSKLDRSATTWRNRVSDLLGEDAQMLVPCELCDPTIPGFHWPPDLEQPRDDLHAHLLDVLRTPDSPEYNQAQHVRRCQLCDGWGVVLSGSRVAGKGQVKCQMCKGNGFVGDAVLPHEQPSQNGEVEVEFPDDTGPLVTGDADVWGSPRLLDDGQENPNYGKMPQYKNPSLP